MQYELPDVPEHTLCVVPKAVEAQDFTVMFQVLLQCVTPLIWPKWPHIFLNLDEGPFQIRKINTSHVKYMKELHLVEYSEVTETIIDILKTK